MSRKSRKITETAPTNGDTRIHEVEFQSLRDALSELTPQTSGQRKLFEMVEKLCESYAADVDAQGRTWLPISGGKTFDAANCIENLEVIRNQSRWLYTFNGLAKGIIDLIADYCCGRSPKVTITHESEVAQKALREAWDEESLSDDVNFEKGGYEGAIRAMRDGEVFHRRVMLPAITIGETQLPDRVGWRFMDPEDVKAPDDQRSKPPEEDWTHGVITRADDAMTVLGYWYMGTQRIPADEVIHVKIGVDSNRKRGLPFLLAAAPDILDYGKFRKSRTLLNIMRSALAIIAELKDAAPGAVVRKANALRAQTTSPTTYASNPATAQKTAWQPGTTLVAGPGTEYKMLDAKIAADDAKEDGRGILLMIAAATNLPEYMVSRDCSNAALASLQCAEAPGIVSLISWQGEFMGVEAKRIRMTLAKRDELKDYLKGAKIEVVGPPIAIVDEEKQTKALAVEKQNSIIGRRTWRNIRGYNSETEDSDIADDQANEIVPDPAADPTGIANEIRKKDASKKPK